MGVCTFLYVVEVFFYWSIVWSPVTIRQHARCLNWEQKQQEKKNYWIHIFILWNKCLQVSLSCHPFKIELNFTLLVQSCHLRMKLCFDIFFFFFFFSFQDPSTRIYTLLLLMMFNGPCFLLKMQTTCCPTPGRWGILQSRWAWFLSLKLSLKPTETRTHPHAGSALPPPLFIPAVPARLLLPSPTSPSIRGARLSPCHPPRLPLPAWVFWQNLMEMPRSSGCYNIAPMLLFISVFCSYSSWKKG